MSEEATEPTPAPAPSRGWRIWAVLGLVLLGLVTIVGSLALPWTVPVASLVIGLIGAPGTFVLVLLVLALVQIGLPTAVVWRFRRFLAAQGRTLKGARPQYIGMVGIWNVALLGVFLGLLPTGRVLTERGAWWAAQLGGADSFVVKALSPIMGTGDVVVTGEDGTPVDPTGWTLPTMSSETSPEAAWVVQHGPVNADFSAVHGVSADRLVAVGRGGIAHWNGTEWRPELEGVPPPVQDVWMAAADDAWAVGNGFLAHWDGARWHTDPSTPNGILRAVRGVSGDAVFVAGKDRVGHWDGTGWTWKGVRGDLRAVHAVSPTDAWAVGDVAVRWDGHDWIDVALPTAEPLEGIASVDDQLYAVGHYGVVLWWDGFAWLEVDRLRVNFTDLDVRGDTLVGVGDNGSIATLRDRTWSVERVLDGVSLSSVLPLDDVRVVVSPGKALGDTTIHAVKNGVWEELALTSELPDLHAVAALSDDDVWAAGRGGAFVHSDGTGFSRVGAHTGAINTLVAIASDDVWALGDKGWRYDGTDWSAVELPGRVSAAWGLGADYVWAVSGSKLLRWDGSAWNAVESGHNTVLNGVWAAAPNDLWLAGKSGILRTDGTTFTVFESGETTAVWGSGPEDVWFGGPDSIRHWDGTAVWDVTPKGDSFTVTSIAGRGPADVWIAVDGREHLLHWTGEAFTEEPTPGRSWRDLAVAPQGGVWVTGSDGFVARRD